MNLGSLRSEVLEKGIDPFVHPSPLAFVGVDDHGKEVMTDFVDDNADEAVFGARVFHAADRAVDRDGDRVRVGEGEL